MKNSYTCIKCDSFDVAKIPGGDLWTKGIFNQIKLTSLKQVLVTRYICINCGYSEEWIDKEKDLNLIQKHYGDKDGSDNPFV